MNEEDFVTLEVAKLLKNKGFNEFCDAGYFIADSEIAPLFFGTFRNKGEGSVSGHIAAPTLYDAQKWLRDKHNIHITIGNSASGYWWELSKADNGTTIYDYNYSGPNDGGKWDTYEEALDAAIYKSLKLIK